MEVDIVETLKLLREHPYYGGGESIEIAKGRFSQPKTIKQGAEQIKREYKWLTKRK